MSQKKKSKIWDWNYRKAIVIYIIISLSSIITDLIINLVIFAELRIWVSFWITYIGLFFVAHYFIEGINALFKQFHITSKFRNLLVPWILWFIIFIYIVILGLTGLIDTNSAISIHITIFSIIALTVMSINAIIRIVLVALHRRKITIFPINRIEYAAMTLLNKAKNNELGFSELKNQIIGAFNIFIDNVYFDDDTAKASIYHLCGLRLADIKNSTVYLNEKGKKEVFIWEDILKYQVKKLNKVLTSRSVLARSFLALFFLSLLKIFIGMTSSDSLMAEGFENFLDCVAVALIAIGIKFNKEKLINVILICLMGFTSISILIGSIQLLFNPEPILNSIILIIISLTSIFLNVYLRALKNFVGKKNRNSSLVASAIDSRVNIFISIGIIIGALFSDMGTSLNLPIFYYLDPIIAICICFLIFKEVINIFMEFITGKEEEIEFESFQMAYEKTFEEYIAKWILTFLNDDSKKPYTAEHLNLYFQESIKKGERIYTEFAHFGLYLFQEKGIDMVINKLIDSELLTLSNGTITSLSKKGLYLHENFYSKPLLEDVKDPFDFFFEHQYDISSMQKRKNRVLEQFEMRE